MDSNNTYSMLSDPEMKEIVDSFLVETKEILEKLDLNLIELENRPDDNELLNDIFRSFHTIKGTSGFLGLNKLTQVTHRSEDILNKLRKGEAVLSAELVDGIFLAYDKIKELLVSIETKLNEDVSVEETVGVLTNLINNLEQNKSGNKVIPGQKTEKPPEKKSTSTKIKNSIKKKPVVKKKKINTKKSKKSSTVKEETQTISIPDDIEVSEIPNEKIIKQNQSPESVGKETAVNTVAKKVENTIRVDVERLDELLNIASELVLGRNRLAQVNSEFGLEYEGSEFSRDLADATKQIDLMTNELQLVVMKTRMVKIGKVFNRFPRLVRDLARETNKQINLVIKGEDTELDKTLIEEINDPLVHLIRNSVDHGIESPVKRSELGKEPSGTIILSAEQEGNQIIITIEDDGKGIDPEIIREKAISKGLISREKTKEFSKQDLYNLIFLPGFSTAEVVTNVSGRGVGMDVVKTNVTKLRGIISIESAVGKGTKIIVKLPLTLAIIPGMLVKVNSEIIVIPLNSVIEAFRIHIEDIHTINGNEVIKKRDSVIPLVAIDDMLYGDSQNEINKIWQYVVVVGLAEKRFGIKVDQLLGQKEVVIKSLGSYLGNINGIAGSTIMGDGTVVMIIDISELINKIVK
jgi:two-component system chemotaxis sensor kinase CheA